MLLPPPDGVSALRRLVASDAWAKQVAYRILSDADAALNLQPASYVLDKRGTLLDVARHISELIQTLGVSWLISGDRCFLRRIADELVAVASFPDWNRSHFIDTAEIMAAVAIGRGWSQSILRRDEDACISDALVRLGLIPARSSFQRPSPWVRANNNWTVVCSAASVLGALSVQNVRSKLADEVLRYAKETLAQTLQSYQPDGGWHEGPGYWALATDYAVLALAALEASGDPDVKPPEAFFATWKFARALTSPAGTSFDYGDNLLMPERCHCLGWLARRSGDRHAAVWQRHAPGEPRPLDLLWAAMPTTPDQPVVGVERFEAGVSTLTDGNIWIGLKGGSNAVNHAHLDLGTIVLEAGGKRFFSELGRQDYAAPGYFDPGRRFAYFRTRSEAHNTIVFGNGNQAIEATATDLGPRTRDAISAAYAIDDPAAPCRFCRAVEIVPNRGVVIADRISPNGSSQVDADWLAHTAADVAVERSGAVLSIEGVTLILTMAASFEPRPLLEPVPCPLGESDNSAFKRLRIPFVVSNEPVILTTMLTTDPAGIQELSERGRLLQRWLAQQRP